MKGLGDFTTAHTGGAEQLWPRRVQGEGEGPAVDES